MKSPTVFFWNEISSVWLLAILKTSKENVQLRVYTYTDREKDDKNFLPAKIKVYMWEKS